MRIRYLTCRRCGLKVKTEERLVVPWSEGDLVALMRRLLSEGQPVYLRDVGITELPLAGLNAILARQGYIIDATNGCDPRRAAACTDTDGGVEHFERFELRRLTPEEG